jgi:hypothetical protein
MWVKALGASRPEKQSNWVTKRDELRNPCIRSLTTRRVSLVTQYLGVGLLTELANDDHVELLVWGG